MFIPRTLGFFLIFCVSFTYAQIQFLINQSPWDTTGTLVFLHTQPQAETRLKIRITTEKDRVRFIALPEIQDATAADYHYELDFFPAWLDAGDTIDVQLVVKKRLEGQSLGILRFQTLSQPTIDLKLMNGNTIQSVRTIEGGPNFTPGPDEDDTLVVRLAHYTWWDPQQNSAEVLADQFLWDEAPLSQVAKPLMIRQNDVYFLFRQALPEPYIGVRWNKENLPAIKPNPSDPRPPTLSIQINDQREKPIFSGQIYEIGLLKPDSQWLNFKFYNRGDLPSPDISCPQLSDWITTQKPTNPKIQGRDSIQCTYLALKNIPTVQRLTWNLHSNPDDSIFLQFGTVLNSVHLTHFVDEVDPILLLEFQNFPDSILKSQREVIPQILQLDSCLLASQFKGRFLELKLKSSANCWNEDILRWGIQSLKIQKDQLFIKQPLQFQDTTPILPHQLIEIHKDQSLQLSWYNPSLKPFPCTAQELPNGWTILESMPSQLMGLSTGSIALKAPSFGPSQTFDWQPCLEDHFQMKVQFSGDSSGAYHWQGQELLWNEPVEQILHLHPNGQIVQIVSMDSLTRQFDFSKWQINPQDLILLQTPKQWQRIKRPAVP